MSRTTIVAGDDGSCLRVRHGDVVDVHLDENPTTGFRWAIDELGSGITMEHDEFHPTGTSIIPGAGGVHQWRIRLDEPGRQVFGLKMWRDWEGESSVIRRFHIDIDVD